MKIIDLSPYFAAPVDIDEAQSRWDEAPLELKMHFVAVFLAHKRGEPAPEYTGPDPETFDDD